MGVDHHLEEIELKLFKDKDAVPNRIGLDLITHIRKLINILTDPSYQYAGTRIHRHAIMTRDSEIDNLRNEIQKLKELLEASNNPMSE